MQLQAFRSTQHGKFLHAPQEEVKSASSPNRVTAVRNLDSHSWETPDQASSGPDMCPLPRHFVDRRVWDESLGGQGVGTHSSKGTSVSWSCLDSGCWGGSMTTWMLAGWGSSSFLPPPPGKASPLESLPQVMGPKTAQAVGHLGGFRKKAGHQRACCSVARATGEGVAKAGCSGWKGLSTQATDSKPLPLASLPESGVAAGSLDPSPGPCGLGGGGGAQSWPRPLCYCP